MNEPLIRIVDDDKRLLEALSFMLELEGWKVATYESAREFLVNDAQSVPGCVVLDVSMPQMSGLLLQKEMSKRGYQLPIIFLTAHGDIEMAVETMQLGAFTFLQKPFNNEKLLQCISEAVEKDRKNRLPKFDKAASLERLSRLTQREKQILGLLYKGKTNRSICMELNISERTVEAHRASIYKKLLVNSNSSLMNFCRRLDLVPKNPS